MSAAWSLPPRLLMPLWPPVSSPHPSWPCTSWSAQFSLVFLSLYTHGHLSLKCSHPELPPSPDFPILIAISKHVRCSCRSYSYPPSSNIFGFLITHIRIGKHRDAWLFLIMSFFLLSNTHWKQEPHRCSFLLSPQGPALGLVNDSRVLLSVMPLAPQTACDDFREQGTHELAGPMFSHPNPSPIWSLLISPQKFWVYHLQWHFKGGWWCCRS